MRESTTEPKNVMSRGLATIMIRVFGALGIVLSFTGLLLEGKTMVRIGFLSNSKEAPFTLLAFYTMSSINFLFMVLLALGGYLLIRYGTKAITFCSFILIGELVYLILIPVLPFTGPIGNSINVATGIGNVAIMAQAVIAYPIIALIGLTLSKRRLQTIDTFPLTH